MKVARSDDRVVKLKAANYLSSCVADSTRQLNSVFWRGWRDIQAILLRLRASL
jgi:hypothetical protein